MKSTFNYFSKRANFVRILLEYIYVYMYIYVYIYIYI